MGRKRGRRKKKKGTHFTRRKKRTTTCNIRISDREKNRLACKKWRLKKKAEALKERKMNERNERQQRRVKRQKLNGIGLLLMAANNMAMEQNNNNQQAKEAMKCDVDHCKNEYDVDWIQCDKCTKWYHYSCVNLTQEIVSKLKEYTCSQCT